MRRNQGSRLGYEFLQVISGKEEEKQKMRKEKEIAESYRVQMQTSEQFRSKWHS